MLNEVRVFFLLCFLFCFVLKVVVGVDLCTLFILYRPIIPINRDMSIVRGLENIGDFAFFVFERT